MNNSIDKKINMHKGSTKIPLKKPNNKIKNSQNKKNEKNFCIKKEQSINIIIINKKETKNFESISNYNTIKNDDKKEEIINEKDKNEEKSSKLKE